jgi:hypothetical protein
MGGCFDARGGQERVEQLKEGIASTPKPRVHLMTEGSQRLKVWRVHIQNDALPSLSLSSPAYSTRCYWLNGKLSNYLRTAEVR